MQEVIRDSLIRNILRESDILGFDSPSPLVASTPPWVM